MIRFIKIIGIGIGLGVFLTLVNQVIRLVDGSPLATFSDILYALKYQMLYAIGLTMANGYFFEYVNNLQWKKYQKFRLLFSFIGCALVTLTAIFFIRMFHEMVWEHETFSVFLQTEKEAGMTYLISTTIALIVFFGFYLAYHFRERQKEKVIEQKVIAGTATAKLDALKSQLDPHFLFNSLNVLTSLIEENPNKATDFTTSLSKVYRYVLEQKDKYIISLDEELEFAKIYMSLLKMRFEDSLIFELPERSKNPEYQVVPLSLQLLLENSVKHNSVTSSRPLKIKIYEQDGYLFVENNLQPKETLKKGSGVGLNNIKERYSLFTNKSILFEQTDQLFRVGLPLLTKNVLIMESNSVNYQDSYMRARKHVDELKEFYFSFLSFFVVIPFLIFINYKTYWEFKWFWFPLLGWLIGLGFQAVKLFVSNGFLGRSWEKRVIEKYMNEEKDQF
ncbi:histidine kinase [Aegicerativicinus sediminis]|uniref:histidine kinase n=1 Tax=Aegicerativicinus sediminis TaxID=2893202 RepID=UPI001E3F8EE4|nr:histidine kinase [Aegicerativicinus sediminis]